MFLKSIIWKGLKYLSNLYFSIILFLFLAMVSILGTIIEQEQSLNYYKLHYPLNNPPMFIFTWKRILWFGLDHMYSTSWFLALLILFFFSLLLCTFSTQLPVLKYSRQWSFLYNQESLKKKNLLYKFQSSSFLQVMYVLNLHNYFVFHKGKGIYAYKGLLGRISPIFVHASIVVTFVGFIFRMTGGLVMQEIVPSGELFHLQNIVISGNESILSGDMVGKINDFFITFNNDQSVQQFFSNISLMNSKKKILSSKYIWVNSPMKFKGFTIYQTDWEINALRLQIGVDKFIVKSLKHITTNRSGNSSVWACDLILDNNHKISVLIPNVLDNILVYDQRGQLITHMFYGVWTVIYGVPILCKDLIFSTGLQIKVDPGLSISYFGFLILMLSIVASYMSYSQIWVSKNFNELYLTGVTNRALLSFEEELFYLSKKITYLLSKF